MRSRRIGGALVVLAGLIGPATALCDPQAEARAHFRAARRLFEHDHPAEARAEFEAAYAALPNARVLANIAACFAAEGKTVEAVHTYRRFLREAGADVPAAARRAAESELSRLHESVADLVISVEPDGAEVLVDGESVGTSPVADPVPLAPGMHQIVVRAPGRQDFTRRLSVYAGREANLSVVLPEIGAPPPRAEEEPDRPEPQATPAPEPAREPAIPPLVWIGGGVAAALAIGGVVTGIIVLGMKSEYDDPATAYSRRQSLHDSTPTLALVTDVLLDSAVVVAAGTLVYYFLAAPGERDTREALGEGNPWDLAWTF